MGCLDIDERMVFRRVKILNNSTKYTVSGENPGGPYYAKTLN
jgi:hypothetical protein